MQLASTPAPWRDLQDGRLVDRVVDRLADLDVAERAVVRLLGVHEHVVGVDQRVVVDLVRVVGVRRHVGELGGRQRVAHHVERPGLDLEEHRVVVLAGLVVDLVEVRLAGLPVGRVLDERRALALGVALQQVRPGPDRLGREGRRVVAGQLLGHDRGERRREHVEERRVGVDQVELDRGRVDDLDPRGGLWPFRARTSSAPTMLPKKPDATGDGFGFRFGLRTRLIE